jgi:hypothetical protein
MRDADVNDVTALMGKLKANVAYLQFADQITDERSQWPVLNRASPIKAEPAAPLVEPPPTVSVAPAPPVPVAPAAPIAAPAQANRPSFLKRYAAPPASTEGSRLLSDIFARLEQKGL